MHGNITNKKDIGRLNAEGIYNVPADKQRTVAIHTKKQINNTWSKKGNLQDAVEKLTINIKSDSSDFNSDISGVSHLDRR